MKALLLVGLFLLVAEGAAFCLGSAVIDFEEFEACPGSVASCTPYPTAFLASQGIVDMIIEGPAGTGAPVVISSRNDPPFVHTATSGSNLFLQQSTTPRPHSLTLVFGEPLLRFSFSRISTEGGGSSTPKWTAEALDIEGQVLQTAAETQFQVSAPARSFSVSAQEGRPIAAVRITSDNRLSPSAPDSFWSTFNSVPMDDLELTPFPGGLLSLEKTGTLDSTVVGHPGVAEPGDRIDYRLTASNTGIAPLADVEISDPALQVIDCPGGHPIAVLPAGVTVTCTGAYELTQGDVDAGERRNTAIAVGLEPDLDLVGSAASHRQLLNPRNFNLASTLDLPGAHDLAIAPNGNVVVLRRIAPQDQPQAVSVVDTTVEPFLVMTTNLAEPAFPAGIAIDPLGRRAYIGISQYVGDARSSANSRLDIVDLETSPPSFVESVFGVPHFDPYGLSEVAVAPGGTRVVAANRGDGTVEVFAADPGTDTYYLLDSVSVGGGANSVVVSPDGQRAYAVSRSPRWRPGVCCASFAAIQPLAGPPALVSRFDLSIGPGASGTGVVVTSDGRWSYAFVAGSPELSLSSPRIAVIDNATLQETGTLIDLSPETTVPGEIAIQDMALSSDDQWLFITTIVDSAGFLYIFDVGRQPAVLKQRLQVGGPGPFFVDTAGQHASLRIYVTTLDRLLVIGLAEIELEKTGLLDPTAAGDPDEIEPGDRIDYTLRVRNTGLLPLTSVEVRDPTVSAVHCLAGLPIPTLAPGATATCTASHTLTSADVAAGGKENTATAVALDPSLDPVSDVTTHSLQFEPGTSLTGAGSSTVSDEDGNWRWDSLEVFLSVQVHRAGFYEWSARLTDLYGTVIGVAAGSGSLSTGLGEIHLSFNGFGIGANGVDGPYFVTDFVLSGPGALSAAQAFATPAYLASQFEGFVESPCRAPEDRYFEDLVFDSLAVFEACRSIWTGPEVEIMESGNVLFRAGEAITLGDGFSIRAGAGFTAVIAPRLAE